MGGVRGGVLGGVGEGLDVPDGISIWHSLCRGEGGQSRCRGEGGQSRCLGDGGQSRCLGDGQSLWRGDGGGKGLDERELRSRDETEIKMLFT